MATEHSRRIPIEKAATHDEIIDAVTSLSRTELKKLQKYARWRIRGLGRASLRRDWQDLFNETVEAFCDEDGRRWDKERVDFVKAFKEAMRSISSNWKQSFDESEARLESELVTTSSEGNESNPFLEAAALGIDNQKYLENKEKIEIIEELLSERDLATLILMGMKKQMTGTEIREDLGITETEYETEMTWIRRTVRRAFKEQKNVKRR